MLTPKTAVFVSGGGTNLQTLIDASAAGLMPHCSLELVVSSRPGAFALSRAERAGIKSAVVDRAAYPGRGGFDAALLETARAHGIEFVILAGFMYVLGKEFTDAYKGRVINVHPSLIPPFCGDGFFGLRVHRAALEYGVKVSGATVFYVNEITDGGKIILQKAVEVEDGDTPEALQRRVMEQAERVILPRAAEMVCGEICGNGG